MKNAPPVLQKHGRYDNIYTDMKTKAFAAAVLALILPLAALCGCQSGDATVEYTLSESGDYYIVSGVSGNKSALRSYNVPAEYLGENDSEPKPVKEIGIQAFYDCTALRHITLPDTITKIGNYAFVRCSFAEINIPYGVTSIGNCAFWRCSALKEIVVPESVTEIGHSAFRLCSSLERAVIKGGDTGITVLYGEMFYNSWQTVGNSEYFSSSLKEVYLPATLKKIRRSAFDGNNLLGDIYFAGSEEQWNELYFYDLAKKEGTENESEEVKVEKSEIIPQSVKIHFNSEWQG